MRKTRTVWQPSPPWPYSSLAIRPSSVWSQKIIKCVDATTLVYSETTLPCSIPMPVVHAKVTISPALLYLFIAIFILDRFKGEWWTKAAPHQDSQLGAHYWKRKKTMAIHRFCRWRHPFDHRIGCLGHVQYYTESMEHCHRIGKKHGLRFCPKMTSSVLFTRRLGSSAWPTHNVR